MTDFEIALSQAKLAGKILLLTFTGSDWCGWCVKLDREVLSTPEFHAWADKKAVVLNVDFPEHTPLAPNLAEANKVLAQKFGIDSFPTVVALDCDGRELFRSGYQPGGPQVYTAMLDAKIYEGK